MLTIDYPHCRPHRVRRKAYELSECSLEISHSITGVRRMQRIMHVCPNMCFDIRERCQNVRVSGKVEGCVATSMRCLSSLSSLSCMDSGFVQSSKSWFGKFRCRQAFLLAGTPLQAGMMIINDWKKKTWTRRNALGIEGSGMNAITLERLRKSDITMECPKFVNTTWRLKCHFWN